jgi:predicted RNase H-like HicB family nuclease
MLEAAGWHLVRVTGSNRHFRHPDRPGTATVAHPVKDISPGNVAQHRTPVQRQPEKRVTMPRYYPAIVEPASEGFGVFFPDVPGCTSAGATVQEAARNAEQALQAHLDLAAEHGEPIPEPSEPDAVKPEPDVIAATRILVRAKTPGRLRRGRRSARVRRSA